MSPPARYTPSRQSPNTVCFEGVGWECAESLAVTRGVAVATILSASMNTLGHKPSTKSKARLRWAAFGLFLALVAFAVVACATTPAGQSPASSPAAAATAAAGVATAPAVSPSPKATTEPQPLTPASPSDPAALFGWLFTPIFQGLYLLLAGLYALTGNIVVAIMLMTLLIRTLTVRLSARQIVSQQRMYRLQPELKELTKELTRRHKGDRQAIQTATQAFYKERGVSPTAGCLPSLLQMGLLFPMYWVIRDGLTSFDPSAMLRVFGVDLVPTIHCPNVVNGVVDKAAPCINTVVFGINVGQPQVLFNLNLVVFVLGVSALAVAAGLLQFVQSRMLMPPAMENDSSASTQRTMMVIFPFFSIVYGGLFPAGVFVYWITTSVFSIVQQFLIVGWGSMFPLFGWNPGFARNHTPRFPVSMPEQRSASAASTVRPNTHRRTRRR